MRLSLLINQQVMPASSNGWLWQLLHAHSCWVAWRNHFSIFSGFSANFAFSAMMAVAKSGAVESSDAAC
jgi:hypothetical protein